MKLWIVIYVAGKIGGTVGPLPYGIEECRERLSDLVPPDKAFPTVVDGIAIAPDVVIVCELHDARPQIEESARGKDTP